MTKSPFQQARRVALDRGASKSLRQAAIRALADDRTRDATLVLLELGSRTDEEESISRAAGAALAELLAAGLVTEWDIRDLTRAAAESFHE